MAESRDEAVVGCEQILGYQFSDKSLLVKALTHASVAPHYLDSNERLEFLGDAVLGLVVCEELFRRYPKFTEGDLTRIKSVVVSRSTCATVATGLGIDKLLFLSKGMETEGGLPSSLSACALESLIGAVYIDGGFDVASRLVLRLMEPEIDRVAEGAHELNYKSMMQQYAQHKVGQTPNYEVLDEKGPDHSKAFEVAVVLDGRRFPSAWGLSKKEAEQKAARRALEALGEVSAEADDTVADID
ncbi:MAG TPA: ribonuclease III [Phycisphaerae bacterium]|nr:ribonuclease III [Phycisphaerae bacterium]HOI53846.1 ribonuclease III [Phycisphaerae bacterium]